MNQFAAAIEAAANATPDPACISVVEGMVLAADGDYFAYACAGGDDCPPGVARHSVSQRLMTAQRVAQARIVEIHLSNHDTNKGERGLISTVKPYQGNRVGKGKPRNWAYLRSYLEGAGNSVRSSHREADDSCAALAWKNPLLTSLYSNDKDFRMLPGWHIDWATYERTFVPYGAYSVVRSDGLQYGLKWFWLQMLQGDTADHIPGIPYATDKYGKQTQCGDVTATHILRDAATSEEALDVVAEQYLRYYGRAEWADRFVEQAMLLWLRRRDDAHMADFLLCPELVGTRTSAVKRELVLAATRTIKRVKEQREQIESLTSSSGSQQLADDPEW
jgi:DNA polymerase-1